jgi:pectate lyase
VKCRELSCRELCQLTPFFFSRSNTYFHDHYKASLVSHSDSNSAEDTGKLHVTYANNHFKNINSRMPLIRFGTSHIINSYFEGGSVGDTAVNTRMGTFKTRRRKRIP